MEGKRSRARSQPRPGDLLTKVKEFTRALVDDLSNGRSPEILIDRFRNYCANPSANCYCSSDCPKGTETLTLRKESHVHRVDVLLRVLVIVQQLLQENRHGSKRDIYYMHPSVFSDQSVVDRAINDICIILQCSRHNLNVVSVGKGLTMSKFQMLGASMQFLLPRVCAGALLFFALLGLSGCFITCYDRRVRNDLAQPCRELCLCCCQPGVCADCHLPGTLCMWTDCTTCWGSCASMAGECGCLSGAGEAGLPILFIMALIVLGLFTIIGIFYSVLVATMVGQRIWQRHYHILAKRMLTKEYVVEDVDGEMTGSDWSAPPLPPEHVQQLKTLGLL